MDEAAAGGEERLRQEIASLGVDDLLALCYAFKSKPERLRLYLDVLRKRGGERAQFASCLICFDLARQGEAASQREFVFLADTIRSLSEKSEMVDNLVGDDQYLNFIWDMCQAALNEMDPRVDPDPLPVSANVPNLDLLHDEDMDPDFRVNADDLTLWNRYDDAVEAFLGGMVGVPVYDPDAGFRMQNSRDVERIERFLLELESLREVVPPARGFRALALLFYGSQMRSKGLFGGLNVRKRELLREGIREFINAPEMVWEVVGVLSPLHAASSAWEKMLDVLSDYVNWLLMDPLAAGQGLDAYDPVERMLRKKK